ncbi:hypothetical protein EYR38_002963 [Pleurotus pulmonarius]|nr:hypothetical protein EYR38_002963 [Pleurotus pulmonarius]
MFPESGAKRLSSAWKTKAAGFHCIAYSAHCAGCNPARGGTLGKADDVGTARRFAPPAVTSKSSRCSQDAALWVITEIALCGMVSKPHSVTSSADNQHHRHPPSLHLILKAMSSPVAENEVIASAAAPAADAEAKRPIIIPLRPGFNCTVRTNSNTGFYSKVPVKLVDETGGREIAKATFVGRASPATNVIDVPLRIQSSGVYEWTIKAAAQKRSLNVDITHSKVEKGPFEPSKIAKPIELRRWVYVID